MFRSRLALAALLAVLGATPVLLTVSPSEAPAAPVPKHLFPRNEGERFPIRVGTTWVWNSHWEWLKEKGQSEHTEIVTAVEMVDGAQVVSIDMIRAGSPEPWSNYKLQVRGNAVSQIERGGLSYQPPVCLLKQECRPGDSWRTRTYRPFPPNGPFSGKWWDTYETWSAAVGEFEEVEVPAGTFRALRIGMTIKHRFHSTLETRWYVAGIGFVKVESLGLDSSPPELRSRKTTLLKSFTPGKE